VDSYGIITVDVEDTDLQQCTVGRCSDTKPCRS